MTPDEVFTELRAIRDEQSSLDPGSARYRQLEARRLELAEESRLTMDASRNKDALAAELEHLEARLAAIDEDKIEVPSWQLKMTKGGRFAINDPRAHTIQINAAIDNNIAGDRAAIEARIQHLKRTLAE